MRSFDYIVIGAGSAGCVIANRLTEDAGISVLLIEAGPRDKHAMIHMPKGFGKIAASKEHAWYHEAKPGAEGAQTTQTWITGRVLGGSSSLNGMQYQRGHSEDYETWERDLGLKGWGWKNMAPIFRSMEDHELGANELRGTGGPLGISVSANRSQLLDKLIEAGGQMGLPFKRDPNEADHEGIGPINATIRAGRRASSAQAFLTPIMQRENLTVMPGTSVDRILFEDRRAVGVAGTQEGRSIEFRAGREVILAAGALNSVRLLQLSGVGPERKLAALGIPMVSNLPGVGQNLREHVCITMQYRLSGDFSQNKQYSGYRLVLNALRYLLTRTGLLAYPPYDLAAFVKTRPGLSRPDVTLVAAAMSVDLKAWKGFSGGIKLEDEPGAQILGYTLQPQSQGAVEISSASPSAPLNIVHNFLSHPYDREVAVATVRYMRALFNQSAIKDMIQAETLPGAAVESDEELLAFCKAVAGPGYHVAGTCKMGHDALGVVDERLRVRGVRGLRVADLSVAPTLLSGNTNGPAMAIGWRASELILEDAAARSDPAPLQAVPERIPVVTRAPEKVS